MEIRVHIHSMVTKMTKVYSQIPILTTEQRLKILSRKAASFTIAKVVVVTELVTSKAT